MTIVNRMVEIIKSKKIVKKSVAERIGVAQSTMETWVGRGEDFPARYIVPLAEALGVSVQYLLTGEDVPAVTIPSNYVPLSDDERYLIDTMRRLDREGFIVVSNKAIEELRRVRVEQGTGSSTVSGCAI